MTPQPEAMDALRVVLALIFVAGLIFFFAFLFKRTGLNRKLSGNKGPARLELVETLYLDPRRRVVILREGGSEHTLLLGASGDLLIASRKEGKIP